MRMLDSVVGARAEYSISSEIKMIEDRNRETELIL